jgi:hypothetical protein
MKLLSLLTQVYKKSKFKFQQKKRFKKLKNIDRILKGNTIFYIKKYFLLYFFI